MSDSHRFTLDSNILVYALDRQGGDRHVLARHVIDLARRADCWLALQAISEFYAAVTRKRRVSATRARDQALDWLSMFSTAPASDAAVRAALAIAASGRASYWDALLVVTAAEAGCTAILTEDLADGASLARVRIVNPFAGASLSPAAEALLIAD
jgi:predicted nucleic acid-binding protein